MHISSLKRHAECCARLGLHKESQNSLQSGVKAILNSEELKNNLILLASFYDRLAFTSLQLGKDKTAVKYSNTSLKIKLSELGTDHIQTALTYIEAG